MVINASEKNETGRVVMTVSGAGGGIAILNSHLYEKVIFGRISKQREKQAQKRWGKGTYCWV